MQTARNAGFGTIAALAMLMANCGQGIGTGTTSSPSVGSTPVSQATPTATPTATPSSVKTCTLARLPNCDAQCCSQGGAVIYERELSAAQGDLRQKNPELFFSNGDVRNNFEYLGALSKRLTEMTGLCAEPLGHDEIRVKGNQDISQHVDVLISDVSPWVGGAYTCRPASF